MKPFGVVSSAPAAAGGGQVFAADLVAKKIIVFYGGITNEEAGKQAPYRYLGGFDNNATVINGVQFAARKFKGETAKWSGDYTDKKRVFGADPPRVAASTGTTSPAPRRRKASSSPSGAEVVYTVPIDTSQATAKNQEEAPVLVAKLKDAGVTTVMLFTSFAMNQAVLKAADSLDYHPEWFFTGMGAQDIEITARILQGLAPEQMKHVFGLGDLPLYVVGHRRPAGELVQLVLGPEPGRLLGRHGRHALHVNAGVSLAGPKLTPKTFQQGLFSMPVFGGAASDQVQSFMFGQGPSSGLPYDEYSQVGLDYALMWWNPDRDGQGQDPLRRGHRPVHVPRQRQAVRRRAVEEGRAQAVRPEQLDLGVQRAAGVRRGARLPVHRLPVHQELTGHGAPSSQGDLATRSPRCTIGSSRRPGRLRPGSGLGAP